MKNLSLSTVYRSLMVMLFSFLSVVTFAQDSTGTVSTNSSSRSTTTETTTTSDWYTQPWVWVVGGAVFLIILIALFRGNSSKEVSRSNTTVIRDDRNNPPR